MTVRAVSRAAGSTRAGLFRPPRGSGCARGAGVCLLLTMGATLTGCRPEDVPPVASEVLREGVDLAIEDMRTFVTREGLRRALVEADTAEFVGETEVHMRPLRITFFDTDGSELSVITANSGIYYELTEDMNAEGSIIVLDRQDDQRLETERLRYSNAEDRLYGDVPFTLWSDGDRTMIQGSSFESDPGLDSVTVISPSGRAEQRIRQAPSPDSAAVPAGGEEAGAAPDSAAAADTGAVASDTGAVASDTGAVASDTGAVASDTGAVAPGDSATLADTTSTGQPPAPPDSAVRDTVGNDTTAVRRPGGARRFR